MKFNKHSFWTLIAFVLCIWWLLSGCVTTKSSWEKQAESREYPSWLKRNKNYGLTKARANMQAAKKELKAVKKKAAYKEKVRATLARSKKLTEQKLELQKNN